MLPVRLARFAAASPSPAPPMSMRLQGNQLVSRMVIEALGVDAWWLGLARNKYERIEKGIDLGFRWAVGFLMPILIDKIFNRFYAQRFLHKPSAAMRVPFTWLEQSGFAQRLQEMAKDPAKLKQLQAWGIQNVQELNKLAPNILKGKLWVVFLDVLIMASQSHFKAWYKNELTEKLSKRKGFSGIFNEVSKKAQDEEAKAFEASKGWRKALSFSVGALSVLALPLILRAILKSKTPVGVGLWGKLKPWLDKFEYKDAVYVSKYLIAYQALINYNIPQLLACRDAHERRETIVKIGLLEFFWFCGDVILSGLGAWGLTRLLGNKLKTPLVEWKTRAGLKVPIAKPLDKLFEQMGKSVTYRWAAANYWMGILLTSLILGISTPLLNNWYTRQKLQRQKKTKLSSPVIPTPQLPASLKANSSIQSSFMILPTWAYYQINPFPISLPINTVPPQNNPQIPQKNIVVSHRVSGENPMPTRQNRKLDTLANAF